MPVTERTGNRIADPDSVWNPDGSRKKNVDGTNVEARIAPSSVHNITEDYKGKREEEVRRYGTCFYEDADKAADLLNMDPHHMVRDWVPFNPDQKAAIGMIEALGTNAEKGDVQALVRLKQVLAVELDRPDGKGPRGAVIGALKRMGITKDTEVPQPEE